MDLFVNFIEGTLIERKGAICQGMDNFIYFK